VILHSQGIKLKLDSKKNEISSTLTTLESLEREFDLIELQRVQKEEEKKNKN
jgi:hypothetical protein